MSRIKAQSNTAVFSDIIEVFDDLAYSVQHTGVDHDFFEETQDKLLALLRKIDRKALSKAASQRLASLYRSISFWSDDVPRIEYKRTLLSEIDDLKKTIREIGKTTESSNKHLAMVSTRAVKIAANNQILENLRSELVETINTAKIRPLTPDEYGSTTRLVKDQLMKLNLAYLVPKVRVVVQDLIGNINYGSSVYTDYYRAHQGKIYEGKFGKRNKHNVLAYFGNWLKEISAILKYKDFDPQKAVKQALKQAQSYRSLLQNFAKTLTPDNFRFKVRQQRIVKVAQALNDEIRAWLWQNRDNWPTDSMNTGVAAALAVLATLDSRVSKGNLAEIQDAATRLLSAFDKTIDEFKLFLNA